jgi:hypothetical protein
VVVFLHSYLSSSGACKAFYPVGNWELFADNVKQEVAHPLPCGAKIKNIWRCISTIPILLKWIDIFMKRNVSICLRKMGSMVGTKGF